MSCQVVTGTETVLVVFFLCGKEHGRYDHYCTLNDRETIHSEKSASGYNSTRRWVYVLFS